MSKAEIILTNFLEPIGEMTKRQDNFPQFAERLASQCADISEDKASAAVDYVMAKWRQKGFPVYALLKEALTMAATHSANRQSVNVESEADYFEAAADFVKLRGYCYAAIPYSLQWSSWLDYHEAKRHKKSISVFNTNADQGFWTNEGWKPEKNQAVPCEWPWEFDRNYTPRQPTVREREDDRPTPEQRERVRTRFAEMRKGSSA